MDNIWQLQRPGQHPDLNSKDPALNIQKNNNLNSENTQYGSLTSAPSARALPASRPESA